MGCRQKKIAAGRCGGRFGRRPETPAGARAKPPRRRPGRVGSPPASTAGEGRPSTGSGPKPSELQSAGRNRSRASNRADSPRFGALEAELRCDQPRTEQASESSDFSAKTNIGALAGPDARDRPSAAPPGLRGRPVAGRASRGRRSPRRQGRQDRFAALGRPMDRRSRTPGDRGASTPSACRLRRPRRDFSAQSAAARGPQGAALPPPSSTACAERADHCPRSGGGSDRVIASPASGSSSSEAAGSDPCAAVSADRVSSRKASTRWP